MGKLYDILMSDIRFQEGLNSCINCGTCNAICPAAEFYDYDPRSIVDMVQSRNERDIEMLLKGETIWYCGECMSCVTRCPRSNAPGLVIVALRSLSQDLGYFVESEKGRQQYALKKTIGEWILQYGYCVYPRNLSYENHPEAGPVWEWVQNNIDAVYKRLGANLDGNDVGALRRIPQESLDELVRIFEVTGGMDRYNKIEECSKKKAEEMGLTEAEYLDMVYNGTEER